MTLGIGIEAENKILWQILVSRNKLVEELMTQLPLTEKDFRKAMKMREGNWARDKEIWGKET